MEKGEKGPASTIDFVAKKKWFTKKGAGETLSAPFQRVATVPHFCFSSLRMGLPDQWSVTTAAASEDEPPWIGKK